MKNADATKTKMADNVIFIYFETIQKKHNCTESLRGFN